MVASRGMDVGDVKQQGCHRSLEHLGKEQPIIHFRIGPLEERSYIFQRQGARGDIPERREYWRQARQGSRRVRGRGSR